MALPKRKTSKRRIRIRKATHKKRSVAMQKCSQCGSMHLSHRVCPSCGYYRGRQVKTVESE